MKVDTKDMISSQQIAEKLEVTPAAVSNWKNRHPLFPKPIFNDGNGAQVYLWWQVKAWAEHYGKMPENNPSTPNNTEKNA